MPPKSDHNALAAALLRTRFESFLHFAYRELYAGSALQANWHVDLMAEHCGEVAAGQTSRLMINAPPRSLKSETGSIALPAFVIGRDPTKQILIVAGTQKLAQELMSKLGRLIRSSRYRALFPHARATFAATSIRMSHGGSITCAVVGQQLSGRGTDLIIIDDPLSPSFALDAVHRNAVNRWYDAEVRTRLNDRSGGAIVVIMQRVHPDDLCDHLLSRESFTTVILPAIVSSDEQLTFPSGRTHLRKAYEVLQPERETPTQLEARLDEIGGFHFIGQYLQGLFHPWNEHNIRVEWLWRKRPDNWKPGNEDDQDVADGGMFRIDVKTDIRARYFGGYDIYSDYQRDKWMTDDEWEVHASRQQKKLLDVMQAHV